jgi:small subunit ribosomal protein S6
MTVFSPDVPEDEIQGTIDRVVGYITTATGEVVDVNRDSPWGRRRLAYAIRHASRDVRDGFYTLYHFNVAPHRVEEIERELRLNDRIMRYLVTQYTPKPIDETAQAQETTETEAPAVTGVEAESAEGEPASAEVEPASATAADGESVTAGAEGERETAAVEATVEEPEAEATEPVEDVAEAAETPAAGDDEADTEEAARSEEE